MHQVWQSVLVSIWFLQLIEGQSTLSSDSYGDVCFNSCPWVPKMLIENADKLKEYKRKLNENEKNIEEYKKKLEMNERKLDEILEWKAKQNEVSNEITQAMSMVTDPSQTKVISLVTNQLQTTTSPQLSVPQLNFPVEGYKVYYVAFLKNFDTCNSQNILLISAKNPASVHIYSRQPSHNKTYNIGSNGHIYARDISDQARVDFHDTVTEKGILVNATDDIWVQGINLCQDSLDGFNAINVGLESIEFLIIAHAYSFRESQNGFVVVATQDYTTVKVFKPLDGGGSTLASQAILNKLDTYAWYGTEQEEVTGFRVTSDKPIAVYAGHPYGRISNAYGDHMVSSIPPVTKLGTEYVVPPIAGVPSSLGYVLKIVAKEANTDITIFRETTLFTRVLNVGEYYSWKINRSDVPLNVRCSKACLVAQFTGVYYNLRFDSFMTVITPNSALSQNVRFGTFADQYNIQRNIYLVVVSFNQTLTHFQLNSQQVELNWYPIFGWGGGSYFYSKTKIKNAFYHLTSTGNTGGFTAYVQGFNSPLGVAGFGYRLGLF